MRSNEPKRGGAQRKKEVGQRTKEKGRNLKDQISRDYTSQYTCVLHLADSESVRKERKGKEEKKGRSAILNDVHFERK